MPLCLCLSMTTRAASDSCAAWSHADTYRLKVVAGKTYMLRIINSALNNQLFFKVAGHNFTVVAVDASYTKPYKTDVVVIAPGQTVDALMVADAAPGRYYMAARPYISTGPQGPPFDSSTTTGIVNYRSAHGSSPPAMPTMPPFNDTATAHRFFTEITGLLKPGQPTVPLVVDEQMFVTFGLGLAPCEPGQVRCNTTAGSFAASMNNVSFRFPTTMSLLDAQYKGVSGVYTADFPDNPPVLFDFTNLTVNTDPSLQPLRSTVKGTKLKKGFGNFNATAAASSYNLVDPQVRNTVAVPAGGWAVIRFVANNPGASLSFRRPLHRRGSRTYTV
ncbi:unnamed protein product [Musa textilis]